MATKNLSVPNPAASAQVGEIPVTQTGTILLDGSTAVFQAGGAMTAIASLTGAPGDSVIFVYVSTLGSGNVRRSFFSVANSSSFRSAAGLTPLAPIALPDIWVIPTLGCETLTFEAAGDMVSTVTINVRFLSNTPIIDQSGLTTLNASNDPSVVSSIGDLESNNPVFLRTRDGQRIDIIVRSLLYAGDTYLFTAQPQWNRERVPRIYKTIDAVTVTSGAAVWTPTSNLGVRLMGYHLSADTGGRYYFREGIGGTLIDTIRIMANWPDVPVDLRNGRLLVVDEVLALHGPTGAKVSGLVWGIEESGA